MMGLNVNSECVPRCVAGDCDLTVAHILTECEDLGKLDKNIMMLGVQHISSKSASQKYLTFARDIY